MFFFFFLGWVDVGYFQLLSKIYHHINCLLKFFFLWPKDFIISSGLELIINLYPVGSKSEYNPLSQVESLIISCTMAI